MQLFVSGTDIALHPSHACLHRDREAERGVELAVAAYVASDVHTFFLCDSDGVHVLRGGGDDCQAEEMVDGLFIPDPSTGFGCGDGGE